MEDVNNSLDKIKAIELSFEHLSDSMNASGAIPKKRRLSQGFEDNSMNLSNNIGNVYANFATDIPPSPRETRRLISDLIEAPTSTTKFKDEMERVNKLNQVTEILNENRISELDFSSNKIQEFEIAFCNDSKEITENSQSRFLNLPDVNMEMERLRSNNKPLQDLLGNNKLPLQEQAYDLCTRLEREEGGHSETVALQVQLNHAQEEIKEWMKVAQDHCQANMLVSPLALRARIEELLHDDYGHFKKELDNLRIENERLRRPKKEELELELQHRCLKDNLIEKLQAEIEHLKRRNKKLEDDIEVTQACLNETTNMTMNSKEINQLRSELESMTCKLKKMDEYYKSARLEFRELVCTLFGYKIDRGDTNTTYKITSMYAESPDQYFNFRLNASNWFDMLETAYSITLESLIESQLLRNKSVPAFFSALTLDLFQRTIQKQCHKKVQKKKRA